MLKKHGLAHTLMIVCLVTAAITTAFLGLVSRAARERISRQYIAPDYVRYLSQGYAFDAVSNKINLLITVTDGRLPVRVHIFTLDVNKHTLDVLELPPDGCVAVDGFSGTLIDAFGTSVYKEIVGRALCMKLDGEASFSAKAFGEAAELLELSVSLPKEISETRIGERTLVIDRESGERAALDGLSYSHNDINAVRVYRAILAGILNEICDRGSVKSFSLLMNLIVNRVETDLSISEIIKLANACKGIKPSKINLHIAPGKAANYKGSRVWAFYPKALSELLNKSFRVYGSEYGGDALGIPKVTETEFIYGGLEKTVAKICKEE